MAISNFVKGLEPIIEIAAKRAGITLEQGNVVVHNYFKSLRKFLDDVRVPIIDIPFGTFKFSKRKMSQSISKRKYHKENGNNVDSRMEELRDKIYDLILTRYDEEDKDISTKKWYNKTWTRTIGRLRGELDLLEDQKKVKKASESRKSKKDKEKSQRQEK